MGTIAAQIKTVEQPVQFLDAQEDGLVGGLERCFKSFGLQALEPKAEAVALPIEDFHSVTVAIQKDEKHGIEYGNFHTELDQRSKAVNGFSEIYRLGVEVHFFDFSVGPHHVGLAPEKIREHSTGDQLLVLDVGLMARLRLYRPTSPDKT